MKAQVWGTAGIVLAMALLSGGAFAQVSPIAVTGWNHDMVIEVGSSPFNTSVTGTMDGGFGQPEGWTWVEQGLYPVWDGSQGVPNTPVKGLVAGTHNSLTGNGTFEFQPFDANNALGLDGGTPSGTLTLTAPAQYATLALYGACSYGGKSATITLTFDDATTSDYAVANGTGIGTDWFNTNADVAFDVGGRCSNKSEEGYTILFYHENSAIHINETFLTLSPADSAKMLASVTVTEPDGDRMSVLAISGEQVPEPASLVLLSAGLLLFRRR